MTTVPAASEPAAETGLAGDGQPDADTSAADTPAADTSAVCSSAVCSSAVCSSAVCSSAVGGSGPAASPWLPWQAGLPRWLTSASGLLRHRGSPDLIDAAVAAACFAAFTLPVLLGAASGIGSRPAIAAFGALAAAPLVWRRRWPVTTVILVGCAYVAATLAGVRFTPFVSNAGPNLAVAVFSAAVLRDRRASLTAGVGVVLATWVAAAIAFRVHPGQDQDAIVTFTAIAGWLAGDIVLTRRAYRQVLQRQQRQQAAEREGRIRAEERLRLSRDVHDVVSHSLSTIAVRSGVARLLLDEQPAEARQALAAIETASRSALDDLRRVLRQTRDPDAEAAAPSLADLPALVSRLRADGIDVSYRVTGTPRRYRAAVELSAYRIAQEALTNVVKHAARARAVVEVRHGDDDLVIKVTDNGPGLGRPAATAGGLGMLGMRERAELLGGRFETGPGPDGGLAVQVTLPAAQGA